jgi:hypothetical protein
MSFIIIICTTDKGTNTNLITGLFWVIMQWVELITQKSAVLSYFAWNHAKYEPELSMTVMKINLKTATKIYSTVAAWF